MTTSDSANIAFEVDASHFAEFSGINVESTAWHATAERLALSSAQRIFYALCKSLDLQNHVFYNGQFLARENEDVIQAHIVMNGNVLVSKDGKSCHVGIGGVFGLAEGLSSRPHSYTVAANGLVTTNSITIAKAQREWPRLHKGLQGIARCTMIRILSATGENPNMP